VDILFRNFELVQLAWHDVDWDHRLPHGILHFQVDLMNRKGWQSKASAEDRQHDIRGECLLGLPLAHLH